MHLKQWEQESHDSPDWTTKWGEFACSVTLYMCVQDVIDFHEAKLDSEINAHFLLNEYIDPHFLLRKI